MDLGIDTSFLENVFYAGAVGLILLGMYCAVSMHHLVRVLLGLMLLEAGVNLFFVATGFRPEAGAPILGASPAASMVDPIPQALILTAIVIGVGVLALALALVVRVHHAYGTLDTRELARHLAREDSQTQALATPPVGSGEADDG